MKKEDIKEKYDLIMSKQTEEIKSEKSLVQDFNLQYMGKYNISKYETEIYSIVNSKNPVEQFRKLCWSEKIYITKLAFFKKSHPEQTEIIKLLEDSFKEYSKLIKRPEPKELSDHDKKKLNKIQLVLDDLYNSGYTIVEYCHRNVQYNIADIKRYINLIYSPYSSTSKKILSELESRDNTNFMKEINAIVYEIMYNPNYTILDYYFDTKLSIYDFKKVCPVKTKQVISFFNSYYDNYRIDTNKISKEIEMKSTRYIKNVEVTTEIKEKIFNYLDENNLPYDKYLYMYILNNVLVGKLNIDTKVYRKGSK